MTDNVQDNNLHIPTTSSSIAKRSLDVFGAAVFGIAAAPFLLLVPLAIRISGTGTPLFRQERIGLNGRVFTLYKFRTMRDAVSADGTVLPDSERLTPVGRFLRKTSLDEIPQLWNVLRGDMSLVGPRPLLVKYLPFYTTREQLRHSVRPGITGWAQIHGRNTLSWDERLEMDIWYVEHWCLRLDLLTIWRTFGKVFARQDLLVDPRAAMLDLDVERSRRVDDLHDPRVPQAR